MTRRLRPLEIQHLDKLPCACPGCAFWESSTLLEPLCGAVCDGDLLRARIGEINREWGECGRVAVDDDDDILGFIKYAPARYYPQALYFAAGSIEPDTPMLACIHIRDDARRLGLGSVLIKAALRDLAMHGERHVMAYACPPGRDVLREPVIGVEFLLRNGFTVAAPHPEYPLLKLDLRALATWAENLDALLQTLRIPITSPQRMPSPSIKCKGPDR